MLTLSRRINQAIVIGSNARIAVVSISPSRVELGIDAPRNVIVDREEVHFRRVFETSRPIDRLQLQIDEFTAIETLIEKYAVLPAIVDSAYPKARDAYEFALRLFIDAIRANGRLDDLLHA